MGYDLAIRGKATDIKRTSGTRNDGSTWERTSFKFLRPKKDRDGNVYEESSYISIWEDLQLTDGETYVIYGDLIRKKDDNGNYNWDVLPKIVMPVGEASAPQKAQAPKPQPQRQSAPAQKPAPQRRYEEEAKPVQMDGRGPESFMDDIPF